VASRGGPRLPPPGCDLLSRCFSIKYFTYANLLEKAGLHGDSPLRRLFDALSTLDFEVVVHALEGAALVEQTYNKEKRATILSSEADKLRRALVHAVRVVHPAHRENIEGEIPACINFLSQFDVVFTLNYDLLLYWVILEDTKRFMDGFGLAEDRNGFRWPFKIDAYCNIYNLHGGLHLFKTTDNEVEKRIDQGSGVIDAIASTILEAKRLPVYVAEGSTTQKLAHIYAVPYLRHCYEKLQQSKNAFFVYGHSAGANDTHVYDALFKSEISHLYFCVHRPTANVARIDGELARYQKRNESAIQVHTGRCGNSKCLGVGIPHRMIHKKLSAECRAEGARRVRFNGIC
jgi:hypothetical protein